ncbi:hypothetical protein Goshw_024355, partial [Gossypium schwendimanii]|nr:hypothetical protein [Gossypium schwendimanii]
AGSLQVLRLPYSKINDSIVEQAAPRLSTVTFLDLSYCPKIGAQAIEAIGKHCKILVTLCRNTYFLYSAGTDEPEDEANAIAATMPGLKHLELGSHNISTECVLNIIFSCPQLEHLDINGCFTVNRDFKFFKEKYPKLKIVGPDEEKEFKEIEKLNFTIIDQDLYDDDFFESMMEEIAMELAK